MTGYQTARGASSGRKISVGIRNTVLSKPSHIKSREQACLFLQNSIANRNANTRSYSTKYLGQPHRNQIFVADGEALEWITGADVLFNGVKFDIRPFASG